MLTLLDLVKWVETIRDGWSYAMQDFKGGNQHLQLHLEVYREPVHLVQKWCHMDKY